MIDMDPKMQLALTFLVGAYYQKGMHDEFVEEFLSSRALDTTRKQLLVLAMLIRRLVGMVFCHINSIQHSSKPKTEVLIRTGSRVSTQ